MTSERKNKRQVYANIDTIIRICEEIKKLSARIDILEKRLEKLEPKDSAFVWEVDPEALEKLQRDCAESYVNKYMKNWASDYKKEVLCDWGNENDN